MKRIHLQFDDALYQAISRNAQSENISVSRYISMCIFDALTPRTKRVADVGMLLAHKERNEDEKKRSKRKEEVKKETTHTPRARAREEFVAPTYAECQAYKAAHPKLADTDVEAFYAYYTTNGWTLANGGTMRNWRSALVKWSKNDSLKVFARVGTKEAARDAKEEREHERTQRERIEAAKDPANWQLCAERCANFRDGKCAKGAKWPPQFNDRPIPPQECSHFSQA